MQIPNYTLLLGSTVIVDGWERDAANDQTLGDASSRPALSAAGEPFASIAIANAPQQEGG